MANCEVIVVGAFEFLFYDGEAILKCVQDTKYGEDKRVFLTSFNKEMNQRQICFTICETDLSLNDGVKCRMIDRNILTHIQKFLNICVYS